MKVTGCLLLILLTAGTINSFAQHSPFTFFKSARGISKSRRESDPLKSISQIETVLSSMPASRNKMLRKNRYILSFQLADLYVRTGKYQKAENLLTTLVQEVRQLKPKPAASKMGFDLTMYDCFEKLGYFYIKTGNLKKADQVFEESKKIRKEKFPKRSVHRIHPIVGKGSLLFAEGKIDETFLTFSEAENLMNKATTTWYDYDNLTRLYLNDLVEICFQEGKNEEAAKYIHKLSIASSGIGKIGSKIGRRMEISRVFELKARYYLLEKDFFKAQEYLDRANQYYSTKIASSDVKLKLLKTQALLYWYQGKIEQSNEVFLKLIQTYRLHIAQNFVSMSEYEKEQFYNTLKSDFNLFNAYTIENNTSNAQKLFEEIYNNALNTKALLLNATNKNKNNIINSGDKNLIEAFHRWEATKSLLSSVYFQKNASSKIDSLEQRVETLEKEINQKSQLFSNNTPIVWTQVRDQLKENEAAIEVVQVNPVDNLRRNNYGKNSGLSDSTAYLVLIIKKSSTTPEYTIIEGGKQLEKRQLLFYRNSITAQTEDRSTYDKLWFPIKKYLKGISKVYLSPDGVYNQINLNTAKDPISNRFLLDEIELVYVTNTADILKSSGSKSTIANAVLFGRPAYDIENIQRKNLTLPEQAYGTRDLITDELVEFKNQEFNDLPGTETEIETIEQALSSRNIPVKTFMGAEADEENVKSTNNPSILHIATHGFFVDDKASQINPMIRSGLILAGVKRKDQLGEDGILTAYEATNLNLEQTKLVVLSACETGLGEVRNGEGVYGLQRAIIVAGANNLLMSLWKVDDEATALLMSEFYKNCDFTDNQTAFRKAQMTLREKYPQPFYWGAFIMLGK